MASNAAPAEWEPAAVSVRLPKGLRIVQARCHQMYQGNVRVVPVTAWGAAHVAFVRSGQEEAYRLDAPFPATLTGQDSERDQLCGDVLRTRFLISRKTGT